MSRDELSIGCTPADEPCVQVGHEHYRVVARIECARYILDLEDQILKKWPDIKISLRAKSSPHDAGSYLEVYAYYDPDDRESVEQALFCEGHASTTWSEESRPIIEALYAKYGLDFQHSDE